MMTFEKVLEVFKEYLNQDDVFEVVTTKRGYTVMIWETKEEQWFVCSIAKHPNFYEMPCLKATMIFQSSSLPITDGT